MRRMAFTLFAIVVVACPYAAYGTTVVLFADDFSNGSLDMPVSINAPDPQADPENNHISLNTSLSGSVFASFAPGARAWHGDNAGGGDLGGEAGGTMSWSNAGSGSGTIAPRVDFVTDQAFHFGKNFTLSIEDLNPVAGGNGASGNWTAISIFQPGLPANGGGLEVNAATTPLGVLIRDNGNMALFSHGIGGADIPFHSDPTSDPERTYDIDLVVTNISGFGPGNSFDYEVLVEGASIASGSIAGTDTSRNYIGLEARNSSSHMSQVMITTVIPEPATAGLLAMATLLLGAGAGRRVRQRRASGE